MLLSQKADVNEPQADGATALHWAVYRSDRELVDTLIRAGDGTLIPLSEVAGMTRANGQGELRRENLRPMAVVSGRLEGRDLGSAVDEIQSRLETLKLPIDERAQQRAAARAEWKLARERPLDTHDVIAE